MSGTLDDPAVMLRRPGRWWLLFAGIWLFYLLSPLHDGWRLRSHPEGWVGIGAVLAFASLYLATFAVMRSRSSLFLHDRDAPAGPRALVALATLVALAVVACLAVGQSGTTCAVYIAVISVISLPGRWGAAGAATVAGGTYLATLIVPGWTADLGILFGTLVATLAVWGIRTAISRNTALLRVREENARFAVEHERDRFARDLHDILGHSLTVITIKAELANRVFDEDPGRARSELADLERLSRDALADVRRAVEGYRDLTLPGELTRARHALDAADIEAHLPKSTDDVPSELRELFAWTVREGVTNVVRHSGAARCTVRLSPRGVEIEDDGVGPSGETAGHGLLGLRERAAALGAVLVTRSLEPHGFLLQVAAP